MPGTSAYRSIVALLLALAGLGWLVVVFKLTQGSGSELAGSSEDFAACVGFAAVSLGGALVAWLAARRAVPGPDGRSADSSGLWLGSALFGCVSLAGAVLAFCGWLVGAGR